MMSPGDLVVTTRSELWPIQTILIVNGTWDTPIPSSWSSEVGDERVGICVSSPRLLGRLAGRLIYYCLFPRTIGWVVEENIERDER